ncbi:MAG TPA: hypothetical protein V6D09_20070 [Leptolyngbyaceae cyanobacterium]
MVSILRMLAPQALVNPLSSPFDNRLAALISNFCQPTRVLGEQIIYRSRTLMLSKYKSYITSAFSCLCDRPL